MSDIVQIILNIILAGGGYALLSIGFNLLYKTRKFIDVSYGSLIAIGGYSMLFFERSLNLPFVTALFLSIAVTVLSALLFDIAIYNPIKKKKKVSSLVPLIASLGVYTAVTALISIIFESQYQSLSSLNPTVFTIFGGSLSLINALMILAAVVGSICILFVLYRTEYGRAIRAIDDDQEVAEISGVPARGIVIKVVAISAVFATIFGILIGYDIGLVPAIGMSYLLRSFIVCVMGGLGSIEGGILSAFILAATENITVYFLSTSWRDPAVFLVFLIVLIVCPRGLFYRPQGKE
jgi:branched-subunit amino acid ABC-type transport system permease component